MNQTKLIIALLGAFTTLFLGPQFAMCQLGLVVVPAIQANAPVAVMGVGVRKDESGSSYLRFFILRNESASRLDRLQLGWTLHDCGPAESDIVGCERKAPAMKGVSSLLNVELHPGQEKSLDAPIVHVDKLKAKLRARGLDLRHFFVVVAGVTQAGFGDGSEWEYDIVNENQWEWQDSEAGSTTGNVATSSASCEETCARACDPDLNQCRAAHRAYVCCCDAAGCWTANCARGCGIPALIVGHGTAVNPTFTSVYITLTASKWTSLQFG